LLPALQALGLVFGAINAASSLKKLASGTDSGADGCRDHEPA